MINKCITKVFKWVDETSGRWYGNFSGEIFCSSNIFTFRWNIRRVLFQCYVNFTRWNFSTFMNISVYSWCHRKMTIYKSWITYEIGLHAPIGDYSQCNIFNIWKLCFQTRKNRFSNQLTLYFAGFQIIFNGKWFVITSFR